MTMRGSIDTSGDEDEIKGRILRIGINDINKLSHESWNCKYHICTEIQKYGVL